MDFIIGDHTAVEVEAKESVSQQDLKPLRALAEEKKLKRCDSRVRRGTAQPAAPDRCIAYCLVARNYNLGAARVGCHSI